MYYRHSIKCRYYLDRIFIIHRLYKVVHYPPSTRTVTDLLYMSSRTTPTVQTHVQRNENSIRSYENLSVSKLVKTAINTAITVNILKSKVTLLNTCEKLKMTHETQRDIGNKSNVNETCYCETCHT